MCLLQKGIDKRKNDSLHVFLIIIIFIEPFFTMKQYLYITQSKKCVIIIQLQHNYSFSALINRIRCAKFYSEVARIPKNIFHFTSSVTSTVCLPACIIKAPSRNLLSGPSVMWYIQYNWNRIEWWKDHSPIHLKVIFIFQIGGDVQTNGNCANYTVIIISTYMY